MHVAAAYTSAEQNSGRYVALAPGPRPQPASASAGMVGLRLALVLSLGLCAFAEEEAAGRAALDQTLLQLDGVAEGAKDSVEVALRVAKVISAGGLTGDDLATAQTAGQRLVKLFEKSLPAKPAPKGKDLLGKATVKDKAAEKAKAQKTKEKELTQKEAKLKEAVEAKLKAATPTDRRKEKSTKVVKEETSTPKQPKLGDPVPAPPPPKVGPGTDPEAEEACAVHTSCVACAAAKCGWCLNATRPDDGLHSQAQCVPDEKYHCQGPNDHIGTVGTSRSCPDAPEVTTSDGRKQYVRCETSSWDPDLEPEPGFETDSFTIEMHEDWAPLAFERFTALVEEEFYTDNIIYRTLPGFLVQFGISSHHAIQAAWDAKPIKDDDKVQGLNFKKGTVSFAGNNGLNSRTTHIFISDAPLGEDGSLGRMPHESPFGRIIDNPDIIDSFQHHGYGDVTGDVQADFIAEGNPALDAYPRFS